jgi:hypothetical protein
MSIPLLLATIEGIEGKILGAPTPRELNRWTVFTLSCWSPTLFPYEVQKAFSSIWKDSTDIGETMWMIISSSLYEERSRGSTMPVVTCYLVYQ